VNSYDAVPYQSDPFPHSQPDRLCLIGRLFGGSPKAVDTARVLELGSAAGNNIIPLAYNFPNSSFLGVELSDVQVQTGNRVINDLRLENIQLLKQDIRDFGPEEGQFDYIICHGTLSWVPDEVQKKIFQICRDNLAPEGLAYISYNCFPGWHLRLLIREMLLYHTKSAASDIERINKARDLAKFLSESIQSQDRNETALLRNAAAAIAELPDWYLFHDLLEQENHPIYFHHFLELCDQHSLSYLADSEVESMWPQEFSADVKFRLKDFSADDNVREQYMDFMRLRTFRRSIIHKGQRRQLRAHAEVLQPLYLATSATLREEQGEIRKYVTIEGNAVETASPALISALNRLAEVYPCYLKFSDLASGVDETELGRAILTCFFAGVIELRTSDLPIGKVTARPNADPLSRYQAASSTQVTNLRHELIDLAEDVRDFLLLLDGSAELPILTERFGRIAAEKGFNLNSSELDFHVRETLEKISRASLIRR
jgi:SAM-dependent methyltransferase